MAATHKKSVLEMDCKEAKQFFMKQESYCPLKLPEYFSFKHVLEDADKLLNKSEINSIQKADVKEQSVPNINCDIVINKDGKYDWRPMKIVHPIAYVDLVNTITSENNWKSINDRFATFRKNRSIKCISMPLNTENIGDSDTKEIILNWWEEFEQYSISAALEYTYCVQTDITNCYGSIYTHSISWAIDGKTNAKKSRGKEKTLGEKIDQKIRNMQFGQTNGIPQGGALFDFIAEIVLGYADYQLEQKIIEEKIGEYQIIRYRDDYRIFSNSKEELDLIVKQLSDTLSELNMHFNIKKTHYTTDLITSAIKPDKLYWNSHSVSIFSNNKDADGKKICGDKTVYHMSLQKHLLEIYILSKKFPNSGSIKKALSQYIGRLDQLKELPEDYRQLISITTNIIILNPNAIMQGVAVISRIFELMEDNENKESETANDSKKTSDNDISEFATKILNRLYSIPNTEYLQIWLQRICVATKKDSNKYSSSLCKKVSGIINQDKKENVKNKEEEENVQIWDSTWIGGKFEEKSVVNEEILDSVELKIPRELVDAFDQEYY